MFCNFSFFQLSASAVLFANSCVFDSISVSMMRRRLARSDEAGLGDLDDRVGQHRRLHFSSARELHLHVDALLLEVGLGGTHQFGGDRLALEVFRRLDVRVFRSGEHQRTLPKLCFA